MQPAFAGFPIPAFLPPSLAIKPFGDFRLLLTRASREVWAPAGKCACLFEKCENSEQSKQLHISKVAQQFRRAWHVRPEGMLVSEGDPRR